MRTELSLELRRTLAELPAKPGVYLHKDAGGKILYVGKAKVLKNRVRSYFHQSQKDEKTVRLVAKIASVDYIVTRSEVEALLLESNFIKQYRPPYNVVLRDDKQYVFIKITFGDTWPRVTTSRQITDDKARYFGPYTSSWSVKSSLKTLRKVFPYCTSRDIGKPGTRPCFHYHLGLCPGPCAGQVTPEAYREILEAMARFLDGQTKDVVQQLTTEMQAAANAEKFERAAALRDKLNHLEALTARQQVVDPKRHNRDVIGLANDGGQAVVILLTVRDGKVVQRGEFTFWGAGDSQAEIIDSFLGQYYKVATNLPDEVLIPLASENAALVSQYLSERRGRRVVVEVPQRGDRKRLVGLAQDNAVQYLAQLQSAWSASKQQLEVALHELTATLNLPAPPARIECFDISNLSGTSTVASMVVFREGLADNGQYRRFRIKGVTGIDDFASMREVIRRRFKRMSAAQVGESSDQSFGVRPDLVIIDGGKGQLSAAQDALAELGIENLPMIGLAKRFEELILRGPDGQFRVIQLPADSQGLYLLQRIRDEAHRFAITYNRNARRKSTIKSALDNIPGIGPTKKKALLKQFGSVQAIRSADLSEIQAVIGQAAGRTVKEQL